MLGHQVGYKRLKKLVMAASGISTRTVGRSGINNCHWLYVGACPNNDVPDRQLIISLSPFFSIIAWHRRGPGGFVNL